MPKIPNELIHETSPYLLQHAYNPVKWKAWSDETLAQSIAEDKPILLSIGYSSCHWCHVMEHQSFEDQEVADLMNAHFINIKVDREERPDIDQIYMDAVQAMNIRGGWPLNVFLTPQKKPFYGGTYFPKEHWKHILSQVSTAFENNRTDINKSAEGFASSIQTSDIRKYNIAEPKNINDDILRQAYQAIERQFDKQWGGLDKEPKFPMPSIWLFLLHEYYATNNKNAFEHTILTLNRMMMGGLYDQVGGGFARYSTDKEWLAPHFEKMLYDNGQLLSLYSYVYQLTNDLNFKEVCESTIEWLKREMTSSENGFYAALDADSEGVEGKFYVWQMEELLVPFAPEADLWLNYFSIEPDGNWEGNNILFRKEFDADFIKVENITSEFLHTRRKAIYTKLLQQRNHRPRPFLDDKQIASWNGLMLKGLVDWYKAFPNQETLALAMNNAKFIETHLIENHRVFHSHKTGSKKTPGFLDDYAYTIEAFIALHEASLDSHWLHLAKDLMNTVLQEFYDESEGFFYYAAETTTDLIARKKELFDNVIPASNSAIAKCLFLLSHFFLHEEWKEASTNMCKRISHMIKTDSSYLSNWASLALWINNPFLEIAVLGPNALEYTQELNAQFLPFKVLSGSTTTDKGIPLLENRASKDGNTYIYICNNNACLKPVASVSEALTLINSHYEKN
jgi:uncharacterized protein